MVLVLKTLLQLRLFAVYENLNADDPKNSFTIGIVDDVTHLSLPVRS